MIKKLFFSCLIFHSCILFVTAQSVTKKVLFLGNSYTFVNDLPQMIANVANSTGNTLTFDSWALGGYTLKGHFTNTTSISKINTGNWDYVVLQEQSQLPSFPITQVQVDVFPFATKLDSVINSSNSCAETVFFMTWGRKNGDVSNCATWPPVCTYEGMDSLLHKRYRTMADTNSAILSPVGAVWKYIRSNYATIDLYETDESHPSLAGTYAAACAFYATLYRKDPTLITFNSSLSPTDAANIRNAAKIVVYNNLAQWNIGNYDPNASFNALTAGINQVAFTNTSQYFSSTHWNFGDGNTSTLLNPTHTYSASGTYSVWLKVSKCGMSDSTLMLLNTEDVSVHQFDKTSFQFSAFPNPSSKTLFLQGNFPNKLSYKIHSSEGKLICGPLDVNNYYSISIESLSTGSYFLSLYASDQFIGRKPFIRSGN